MKLDWGIRARWAVPMAAGSVDVHEDHFIGFKDGRIELIEKYKPAHKKLAKKFIDGKSHVLLPGFVNGHAHLPMTLLRGVEDDAPLNTWLFERILPLEAKFVDKKFIKAGVELAALECTRFGVTTVNDMYFYAGDCASVWDKAGLRGIFYQVFTDFELPEYKELGPDTFGRFRALLTKYAKNKRITIGLGPHAPYTCGDAILREIATIQRETGCPLQVHLSETAFEVSESHRLHGKSPVHRLNELGILTERTNCAHGVHLSDDDIRVLAATGASVVHNPDSNTKLASGIAPIVKLRDHGVKLGLGTDGTASNNDLSLFGAMDLAAKMQKLATGRSDSFGAADVLRMATIGGAEALGLKNFVGSLEVGKQADLLLVNFDHAHLRPVNDVVSHLVYSCSGLEVDTVFCAGKLLLRDGKHTVLKKDPILKNADRYRDKIMSVVGEMRAKR